MRQALALVGPTIHAHRRRLLMLLVFAALFLVGAATAAALGRGPEGHVEIGRIFELGGYPLASALLLMGWLLGRFPLIATIVLVAGLVSHDREAGYARLYAVRPVSPLLVYGVRLAVLALLAFALSAAIMPAFDLIMLGTWAGPATLVLIAGYVVVYGSLTALLSVWTRADGWVALALAVAALVWDALRQAGHLQIAPVIREFFTFILPPQAALLALESAFADIEPIPWDAFLYAAGYGTVLLVLAGVSLAWRET